MRTAARRDGFFLSALAHGLALVVCLGRRSCVCVYTLRLLAMDMKVSYAK